MIDSIILETGKFVNGFVRGLSGIGNTFQEQPQQVQPQYIQPQPQLQQVQSQQVQPKAPCTTCGKMAQLSQQPQIQPQPQPQPQIQQNSSSILFNGGPSIIKRPPGSQQVQEPNSFGIKFS